MNQIADNKQKSALVNIVKLANSIDNPDVHEDSESMYDELKFIYDFLEEYRAVDPNETEGNND